MPNKPNLSRAWRRTFWHVYDNLGFVLLVNILWLLFSLTIIFLPSATISLFYMAYLIVHDRPVRIKYFFIYIVKYFLKSTSLILLLCIVCLLLVFNMIFYLKHFRILGIILAGISFWLCFFSAMAFLYILPLLCRRKGILKTLWHSYLLVLDNFKMSLILFITSLILLCLEIVIPIIGIAIMAVFIQNAFLEIEARYNQEIEIAVPKRRLKELFKMWEFP